MKDLTWYRELGWARHVESKRSVRQARRSSYDAGFEAALGAVAALLVEVVALKEREMAEP